MAKLKLADWAYSYAEREEIERYFLAHETA